MSKKTNLKELTERLHAIASKMPGFVEDVEDIEADEPLSITAPTDNELSKGIYIMSQSLTKQAETAELAKNETVNALSEIVGKLEEISSKTRDTDQTEVIKAIETLKGSFEEVSKREIKTTVEVKAPEPIVETHIIQENEKTIELIEAVEELTKAVDAQSKAFEKIIQKALITNNKPSQAIPVQLVNKAGTKYQDISDISGASGSVIIGGSSGGDSGIPFNVFVEDASVPTSSETTIVSYVIPGDAPSYIGGVLVSCGAAVKFKLKIDGIVKAVGRTSASHPTENIQFGGGEIKASSGATVTVTAYHEDSTSHIVDANLYGNS